MVQPQTELAVYRFVHALSARLSSVRDEAQLLRHALRSIREFFAAERACLAVLTSDNAQSVTLFGIPREAEWPKELIAAFLRGESVRWPTNMLLTNMRRRGRPWAAVALARDSGNFSREASRALAPVVARVSELLDHLERVRALNVLDRVDRKIMEQLRPRDLFYHILHGLRSLMRYDHSSSLFVVSDSGDALTLVAEQLAWQKGKSRRIGLHVPLSNGLKPLMQGADVFAFARDGKGIWVEAFGRAASELATALDLSGGSATDIPNKNAMLCAPIATSDGVIGAIKVASQRSAAFGTYELGLMRHFAFRASVAIQYMRHTESLETRMLAAERKHVIANIARGVSHDINNALGAVIPLVQQLQADAEARRIDAQVLGGDLEQIERSLQVCRRIFGGMLNLARGSATKVGEGNLRRALDGALAILRARVERRGVDLKLDVPDDLPLIRTGQANLEQLFLNLLTNALDAMPSGGELHVRAARKETYVEAVIEDSGHGISQAHMERIHEPFFTTKPNGSGLGLSICRSIVWEMRGRMVVANRPQGGTIVSLILPAVTETGGESE